MIPKDEASIMMPELGVSWVDIEEQLRATMKRFEECEIKLTPLPEGCVYNYRRVEGQYRPAYRGRLALSF